MVSNREEKKKKKTETRACVLKESLRVIRRRPTPRISWPVSEGDNCNEIERARGATRFTVVHVAPRSSLRAFNSGQEYLCLFRRSPNIYAHVRACLYHREKERERLPFMARYLKASSHSSSGDLIALLPMSKCLANLFAFHSQLEIGHVRGTFFQYGTNIYHVWCDC